MHDNKNLPFILKCEPDCAFDMTKSSKFHLNELLCYARVSIAICHLSK